MVHPYLARRSGKEKPVTYAKSELNCASVLSRHVRRAAVPGTGDANRHRGRSNSPRTRPTGCAAPWRRSAITARSISSKDRFIEGMVGNGYERDFAERCFQPNRGIRRIRLPPKATPPASRCLVYASSWIKCHYPDGLRLRHPEQPADGVLQRPAQLVRDAIDHGVEVRPVDAMHRDRDCTLEEMSPRPSGEREGPAKRAGEGAACKATPLSGQQICGTTPSPADCVGTLSAVGLKGYITPSALKLPTAQGLLPSGCRRPGRRPRQGRFHDDARRLACARAWASGRSKPWPGAMAGIPHRSRPAGARLWAAKGLGPRPLPLFVRRRSRLKRP